MSLWLAQKTKPNRFTNNANHFTFFTMDTSQFGVITFKKFSQSLIVVMGPCTRTSLGRVSVVMCLHVSYYLARRLLSARCLSQVSKFVYSLVISHFYSYSSQRTVTLVQSSWFDIQCRRDSRPFTDCQATTVVGRRNLVVVLVGVVVVATGLTTLTGTGIGCFTLNVAQFLPSWWHNDDKINFTF